jgi:hypothetical protein
MRYIKKYNESNSEVLDEQEIKDFCEMNLAYLLDDGMRIIVDTLVVLKKTYDKCICVDLSFRAIGGVRWETIKDHVIPFLIRLKSAYNLYDMERYGHTYQIEVDRKPEHENGSYEYCLTIDEVIDESAGILKTGTIKHIRFYI